MTRPMLWLFHRRGEYLSCEVRTCLRNHGFEVVIRGSSRPFVTEWHPTESDVQHRWDQLNRELRREGEEEFSQWGNQERADWARVNSRGSARLPRVRLKADRRR